MASVTKVGFQRDGRDLELDSAYPMAHDLSVCGMNSKRSLHNGLIPMV